MNNRDQTLDESSRINEIETEETSPASSQSPVKCQPEGVCVSKRSTKIRDPLRRSQKANSSQRNEETEEGCSSKLRPYPLRGTATKYPTIDQVSSEDEDDHLNVEGYSSDSTVNQIFSRGRDYIERPATRNNQATKSNLIKSIVNNNNNPQQEEDEVNDDQLPILSPSSIPRTSGYSKYKDEAVTSKTPPSSENESSEADDEVNTQDPASDKESESREVVERAQTDRNLDSILPSLEDGEVVEFTPTDSILKGRDTLRSSKSLELNSSQANRALSTLKAFKAFDFKRVPTSSSANASEEVAESTQVGPKKGRPRKGDKIEPKTDASQATNLNKPLTRSREKANSQSQSQHVQPRSKSTSEKKSQLIAQTKIPNGSGITIVRHPL